MQKEFTGPRSHKGWETLHQMVLLLVYARSLFICLIRYYEIKDGGILK